MLQPKIKPITSPFILYNLVVDIGKTNNGV